MNGEIEGLITQKFEGNLVPHIWYKNLRTSAGMADIVAITILSDIVYWYRPRAVHNDDGPVTYHKRFKGLSKWFRPGYFSNKFGLTSRQVDEALRRLKKQGIIKYKKENITTDDGNTYFGAARIMPIVEKVLEISSFELCASEQISVEQNTDIRKSTHTYVQKDARICVKPVTDMCDIKENTKETSKEIINMCTSAQECVQVDVQKNNLEDGFDEFWKAYRLGKNRKRALKVWTQNKLYKIKDQIIEHVKQTRLSDWQYRPKSKIPHPSTYLNGECWNDEIISREQENANSTRNLSTADLYERNLYATAAAQPAKVIPNEKSRSGFCEADQSVLDVQQTSDGGW
ncbi:hypothetical protein [Piscirickettsia litoralis]|uniref:Uncharacterized protein n=1 Tax=Piscirickettsia litoralis TaxID=1891921 RepID=A0ABX2ZX00_9GAMM|nr:hypothetical protein [Piscirickettsia litoralis]ODN41134.1 hypothetical protein BGC07_17830 [Piscirickettsia litoralis]